MLDIKPFMKYESVPGRPGCTRRVMSFPWHWVQVEPGRVELMYQDEYVAMCEAEKAAKDARRAAREAELAAGRPEQNVPSQDAPLVVTTSAADSVPSAAATAIVPARSSNPPDLCRHSRRCSICSHRDRDAIEAEFIRWRSPQKIAQDYNLGSRLAVYRHAHAAGLFPQRRRHIGRVLESFLETIDDRPPVDFDPVTRAIRVYAHLDENGSWVEPDRTVHIIAERLSD